MADRLGLTVKWWASSKEDGLKLTAENLKPLLSDKVKFVACTHVSNILGTIHDVKSIADAVHEVGALFCVDGVSYAPHRAVDVKAFGVDFYAFSWYKVCRGHQPLFKLLPHRHVLTRTLGLWPSHRRTLRQRIRTKGHETHGTLLQSYQDA